MKKLILVKSAAVIMALVVLQLALVSTSMAAPPRGDGWRSDGWGCGNGTCYRVEEGDTMFSIGRQFNLNPYYIAQYNHLPNPNWIFEGQTLCIPAWGPTYPWDGVMYPPAYPMPYRGEFGPHPYVMPYSDNGPMDAPEMGQQMYPGMDQQQMYPDMGQQMYPGMEQQQGFDPSLGYTAPAPYYGSDYSEEN